ncbi:MAG: hypothetical protein IJE50_04350 [Clostridia bacterium]|nr:hypothetical protein [Clostridia bacterium]MBQ2914735.1 hypothetical protein [Clostridia bacterium]MBQ4272211.1 hypothetical protein [Clostridia bacterium]
MRIQKINITKFFHYYFRHNIMTKIAIWLSFGNKATNFLKGRAQQKLPFLSAPPPRTRGKNYPKTTLLLTSNSTAK